MGKRLFAVVVALAGGHIVAHERLGGGCPGIRYRDGTRFLAEGGVLPPWLSSLKRRRAPLDVSGLAVKRATSYDMAACLCALPCRGHDAVRAGGASWKHPTKGRYPTLFVKNESVSIRRSLPRPPKRAAGILNLPFVSLGEG